MAGADGFAGALSAWLTRMGFLKLHLYALIGGAATGIHLIVAAGAIRFGGVGVLTANIIGFVVAFSFSYLLQSRYVFGAAPAVGTCVRYFCVQAVALGAALWASAAIEDPYVRTVCVVILLPFMAFFVHKVWTFKSASSRGGGGRRDELFVGDEVGKGSK